MKRCLAAALMTVAGSAWAGPSEDNAVGSFEFLCATSAHPHLAAARAAQEMHAVELPSDQASPFLRPQTGRAWFVSDGAQRVILTATDVGGCGVFAPDVDGLGLVDLFEKNAPAAQRLDQRQDGSQIETYYLVRIRDQDTQQFADVVVIITRSNLASVKGASMALIPKAVMQQPR